MPDAREGDAHSCEHCDEHDMVPDALAQRFKDERNIAREHSQTYAEENRRLRRELRGAVSLDDPNVIETLARVIENRHGTLHGIGSTLREAVAELKRGAVGDG